MTARLLLVEGLPQTATVTDVAAALAGYFMPAERTVTELSEPAEVLAAVRAEAVAQDNYDAFQAGPPNAPGRAAANRALQARIAHRKAVVAAWRGKA